MGCFFYKSYEELLEFAKSQGIEETPPMDVSEDMEPTGVIDFSEEKIKSFLSYKGHTAQDLNEALISCGAIRPKETEEG